MQNENIHNHHQPDNFSKYFRQQLEQHELPVDAGCWNEIEARMNAGKKKRVIPFWWWVSGGAIAACFALVLTVNIGKDSGNLAKIPAVAEPISQKTKITAHAPKSSGTFIAATAPKTDGQTISRKIKQTDTPAKGEIIISDSSINRSGMTGETAFAEEKTNISAEDKTQQISNVNKQVSTDSAAFASIKKIIPETLAEANASAPDTRPVTKNNSWLLAASFESGGNQTNVNGTNNLSSSEYNFRSLTTAKAEYTSIMSPNDFTEKNFLPPLSFGLTVRKSLGKTFGIESGLVYTYLLSTFKRADQVNSDASLSLHYLGIPVSLVAKAWSQPKWEIYVSCGPMVEKGLRSVYEQRQHFGNQIYTTKAATKIDGLQWSVNAGIGATYKLQRNIGIYFEPKFAWFFNNNQPISARTDQPMAIGLSAGIRYNFK